MSKREKDDEIAFQYHRVDSATGISRETAQRLAKHLGMSETQIIHHALYELARRVLPQYEKDDGPLNDFQLEQIKQQANCPVLRSVRSTLLSDDAEAA
ncbi:hypothetical protein [Pseudoduganella violacea]|uniref:Uncharacterized protein n=1 Tax=Pseudoduganella violacea TaxID=1715466 RepID=A0A7W5FVY8_9BURK|nr:hypothetical protein [Pseudoduganella violacea]MBB3121490.1 hypothetical protein [Pseudoduganella violacea]